MYPVAGSRLTNRPKEMECLGKLLDCCATQKEEEREMEHAVASAKAVECAEHGALGAEDLHATGAVSD